MNRTMVAVALILFVSCGGSTETDGAGGEGAQAGSGGTGGSGGQDASDDALSEASNDAADDAEPWANCFSNDNVRSNMKLCSGAGSCLIKAHMLDCCGTIRYVGVAVGSEAEFDACEAAWQEQFPDCGCASGLPRIEQPWDGEVNGESEVDVQCINCSMETCVCITVPK